VEGRYAYPGVGYVYLHIGDRSFGNYQKILGIDIHIGTLLEQVFGGF
jgi:hypothetical protein